MRWEISDPISFTHCKNVYDTPEIGGLLVVDDIIQGYSLELFWYLDCKVALSSIDPLPDLSLFSAFCDGCVHNSLM
jgi:hypothetical protein